MNLKVLITVLLTIVSSYIFAREKQYVFSLKEAQEYARLHNKTLMAAKHNITLSEKQVKESKAAGLPQINGSVDYMTNFNYEFDFNVGGGGSTTPPDINYNLLDAGDLEVLNFLNQMMAPAEGTSIVMEDQMNAAVQVSQLLFNGQYWTGIKLAKIGERISEKNLVLTELDVKESVTNTYYLILVTEDLLRILNENYENLQETLKHTANMFNLGLAEQVDVDQIGINLSLLENSRKAMERNLQLNYNMFRFFLGIEAGDQVLLSDNLDGMLAAIEKARLQQLQFDIQNSPSYQIMQIQEEIGAQNINMQKWAYAPTLSGFYSYTEKLMTTGFDLSPNSAAGVNLSIPIFSGGTRSAQLSKAKIELDKTRINRELLKDQLNLQDNQLTYNLNNTFENYVSQKQNVEIARRVFDNINNKFKQGMLSSLDLTQANANYLQAENNYSALRCVVLHHFVPLI